MVTESQERERETIQYYRGGGTGPAGPALARALLKQSANFYF